MQDKDMASTFEDRFYTGVEIDQIITERMSNVDSEQRKIIEDLKKEVVEQRKQRAMLALENLELDEGFINMLDLQTEDNYQQSMEILQKHAQKTGKKKVVSTKDAIRKIMGLK